MAALAFSAALVSCNGGGGGASAPTEDETTQFATMALDVSALPASPTIQLAEDPAASARGRLLVVVKRRSADDKVACANCHDPKRGFSDPKAVSTSVSGRKEMRHSLPATTLP